MCILLVYIYIYVVEGGNVQIIIYLLKETQLYYTILIYSDYFNGQIKLT